MDKIPVSEFLARLNALLIQKPTDAVGTPDIISPILPKRPSSFLKALFITMISVIGGLLIISIFYLLTHVSSKLGSLSTSYEKLSENYNQITLDIKELRITDKQINDTLIQIIYDCKV